jgi:hypothetical protein
MSMAIQQIYVCHFSHLGTKHNKEKNMQSNMSNKEVEQTKKGRKSLQQKGRKTLQQPVSSVACARYQQTQQ